MFLVKGNPYSEGRFLFKGGNPEMGDWYYIATEPDAVFRANFGTAAVVPEASSILAWSLAACTCSPLRIFAEP